MDFPALCNSMQQYNFPPSSSGTSISCRINQERTPVRRAALSSCFLNHSVFTWTLQLHFGIMQWGDLSVTYFILVHNLSNIFSCTEATRKGTSAVYITTKQKKTKQQVKQNLSKVICNVEFNSGPHTVISLFSYAGMRKSQTNLKLLISVLFLCNFKEMLLMLGAKQNDR